MRSLSTFWYVFKNTFTSREYYRDVVKAPFSFSLKFFFLSFTFFAALITVWMTATSFYPLHRVITEPLFLSRLAEVFPEELVITIDQGVASSNVQEPYAIPMERLDTFIDSISQQVKGANSEEPASLLVVDTKASVEDIFTYNTAALLTKHSISVRNGDGEFRTYRLSEDVSARVDRNQIEGVLGVLAPYLRVVIPLVILVMFLCIAFLFPLFNLLYLLLASVLLWIVSRLFHSTLSYGKVYQIGLHLCVIVTVVSYGVGVLVPRSIPYFDTILLLLLGGWIFQGLDAAPSKSVLKKHRIGKNK